MNYVIQESSLPTWAGIILAIYCMIRFTYYLILGNKVHRGFTFRSYATACTHEGVLLPLVMGWGIYKAMESDAEDWLINYIYKEWDWNAKYPSPELCIHLMLIAYMISDFSNMSVSPGFDSHLVIHHIVSSLSAVISMSVPYGSALGALGISVLEFGSLWINVASVYETPFMFKLRFFMYTLTRTFAASACVALVLVNISESPVLASVFAVISAMLITHNIQVGYKMFKSLVRKRVKEN